MPEKKPKPKRSKVKNPSLKKRYNSRIRQEYIDMDYIGDLDDTVPVYELSDGTMVTELEFMSIFMKEWNNAGVAGAREGTSDDVAKERNKLHRTQKDAKMCTDQNNARNRCAYSIAKARNLMMPKTHDELQGLIENETKSDMNYMEDAMVDYLNEIEELGDPTNDTD